MKNELGIEVCCFNCSYNRACRNVKKEYEESKLSYSCFRVSKDRLITRIKELQLEVKRLKEQKVEYKKIIEEIKERYEKRIRYRKEM